MQCGFGYFDQIFLSMHIQTAASVVQEQCEADDDLSIQQRIALAGATTLDGAAEIVGEENEIAGGERFPLLAH